MNIKNMKWKCTRIVKVSLGTYVIGNLRIFLVTKRNLEIRALFIANSLKLYSAMRRKNSMVVIYVILQALHVLFS